MDFNFDKKRLKQLKQLGLTDNQIEYKRITTIIEYLLDYNCERLSKEFGRSIKYGDKGNGKYSIYLVSESGRYCEFYTDADDVALHYESAEASIRQELSTRFYYIK